MTRIAWFIAIISVAFLTIALPRTTHAATTQQLLEMGTNLRFAGTFTMPAVQQVVSYTMYHGYALTNWTAAGGNSGGQLVLKQNGSAYRIVFGSGGAFALSELTSYGVPSRVAAHLLNPANWIRAEPDRPPAAPIGNSVPHHAIASHRTNKNP